MQIWFLISEETRRKLLILMSKLWEKEHPDAPLFWEPPRDDFKPIAVKGKIESPEEIDHLMRQRPHYPRGKGYRGG